MTALHLEMNYNSRTTCIVSFTVKKCVTVVSKYVGDLDHWHHVQEPYLSGMV